LYIYNKIKEWIKNVLCQPG